MKAKPMAITLVIMLTLAVALPGLANEQTPPDGRAAWGEGLAAKPPHPRAGLAAQPWQSPPRTGPGAVITVTTTADELNSDGDCSLREAIQAANANAAVDACVAGSGDDTVVVPSGTYTLTRVGPNEDANQTGDLDILDNVVIDGAGANLTILNGNSLDRILDIQPGRTVTIEALTVAHGQVMGQDGGGLFNQGVLTLDSVTVRDNTVGGGIDWWCGGLANEPLIQDATATLDNCLITANTASGGGGLCNWPAAGGLEATMTIISSTISSNTATTSVGGGILHGTYWPDSAASLTVIDSVVENNTSSVYGGGGGIYGQANPPANATTVLMVDHSTIRNNSVTTSYSGYGVAGGLYSRSTTTTILDSTIDGNSATCAGFDFCGGGGGLLFKEEIATVTGSTISHNTASGTGIGGLGGGVFLLTGAATFANCTISGNQVSGAGIPDASGLGGGIAAGDYFGAVTLVLTNTTITGNSANIAGGGVAAVQWGAGVAITFTNNLLGGNNAPAGMGESCANPDIGYGAGTLTSLGYNLEDYDYCGFTQATDQPATEPAIGPLADNGGATQTHALLGGSPGIDQGNCPGFAADQRGLPRPVDIPGIPDAGDGCDIGTYELQSLSLIDLTKTAGTDPAACAETNTIVLPLGGGDVTYCYQVENSGTVTLTLHELWDDELGQLLDQAYELPPGGTLWLTATATITETTVNRAVWTAYNPGPTDVVSATDTALVVVRLPYQVYLPLIARSGP